VERSSPKILATSVFFKKTLLKVNNHPAGKIWPNLVTLVLNLLEGCG
jgi:hypothetical protein